MPFGGGSSPTTLPPSGAAGGSLSGTYPNPSIAAGAISAAMLGAGVGSVNLYDSGFLTGTGGLDSGAGGFATTYGHLRVLLIMRDTGAGTVVAESVRFNNDSGAVYDANFISGNNVTVSIAAPSTAQTSAGIGLATAASATAGRFGVTVIDIPGYGNAAESHFGTFQSAAMNAGAGADSFIRIGGVQYRPASPVAISRVSLVSAALAVDSRMIVTAW